MSLQIECVEVFEDLLRTSVARLGGRVGFEVRLRDAESIEIWVEDQDQQEEVGIRLSPYQARAVRDWLNKVIP